MYIILTLLLLILYIPPTPYLYPTPGVIHGEGPAQGGGEAGQRREAQAGDGAEGQRGCC